jgi:hypothetical protein
MAKKGIFRRFAERITAPVKTVSTAVTDAAKKTTGAVKDVVTAPFTKKTRRKPAPKPRPKVSLERTTPRPRIAKPRPNPALARELLHQKLQDMYWLQKKWDAAAMTRRINRMTDDQVYKALDLSENDIETAARVKPSAQSMWADPEDPTNKNIMWYHGGETMVG